MFPYKTITDFDFGGVDGTPNSNLIRVGSLMGNNVEDNETKLILWFLLERELHAAEKARNSSTSTFVCDSPTGHGASHVTQVAENQMEDENYPQNECQVDYKIKTKLNHNRQENYAQFMGISPAAANLRRCTQQRSTQIKKVKKFSEDVLRYFGYNVDFDELNPTERQNLFMQFSASSALLSSEKFGSIIDIYEGFRKRSKFREQYVIRRSLGKGSFGDVFEVQSISNSNSSQNLSILAIKKVELSFENIDEIRMSLTEASALKALKAQKNIIQLYDSWIEINNNDSTEEGLVFYLAMESCSCNLEQWLSEIIKNNRKYDRSILLEMSRQMIEGLEIIHKKGYLHLDINPRNILWSQDKKLIKIGDFGFAVKGESFDTSLGGKTGTIPYSPSEQLLTSKSDIYSLGVTLLEISQKVSTKSELIDRIAKRNFHSEFQFLNAILYAMIEVDPVKRPNATDIKNYLNRYVQDNYY